MEIDRKEEQWKKPISYSSSSRSSSITSNSSDGHFDIRNFPLPKPTLSRKQRDSYTSNRTSYTGSSWSSVNQNHLVDLPNYDPNRIPSSVFSSKPANSADWSLASNESLFSIQDGNFSISTIEDHGLAAPLRSEINSVYEITEINSVPLPPPPRIPTNYERVTVNKPYQVEEISYSDIDDHEEQEMIELESNNEEEEAMIIEEVLVEIESENSVEKALVQDVNENKPEDSKNIITHSPSISCLSDTSNNSVFSFVFPVFQKEDGVVKTPSLEMKYNVSHNQYQLPRSPMQPSRPQSQLYSESSTLDTLQPQSKPKLNASKQFESKTQSPRAARNGWFSCFICRSKRGLFK